MSDRMRMRVRTRNRAAGRTSETSAEVDLTIDHPTPHSRPRHSLKAAFAAVFIGSLLTSFLDFRGLFRPWDAQAFDSLLMSNAPSTKPQTLIVSLSDPESKGCIAQEFPARGVQILSLVAALSEKGASAIGVDILTKDGEYEHLKKVFEPLITDKETPSVIWAIGGDSNGDAVHFGNWFFSREEPPPVNLAGQKVLGDPAHPGNNWALPAFPMDHDGSVRRIQRSFAGNQTPMATRLASLARHSDPESHSVLLIGQFQQRLPWISAAKILRQAPVESWKERAADLKAVDFAKMCSQPPSNPVESYKSPGLDAQVDISEIKDKIVLIGVPEDPDDFHRTALGTWSGVALNGAAVEAELNHHFLMELPWLAFLVDLLIGWTLAWICIRQLNGSVRWLFGLSAAAAFVLYTLSRNLAGQHIAWYSWVGAIGGLLVGFVIHALMHRGEAAHN